MGAKMNFMPFEIAFWILLFLLVHCYVLFPVTLPFLSELFARRNRRSDSSVTLPKVSVLVSAYNEEAVIEKKILNFLELDYPRESLEILIGDDGSSDRTAEIVERYADKGIRLVRAVKNAGKAAMLNRLQSEATGEILVFCDANTMLFPNVIRKLVSPFADQKIGCVCGHLILTDKSGSLLGSGELSYWDFESEIKKFEGILDRLIGGNGALYAIRNSLYTKLPVKKSVMDDFFIAVKVLQKGFFCTFDPSAIGTEQTSKEGTGEYRRKIRIGRANYNYLFSYLPLLNPFRPLLAYLFVSHKLLRWLTPHIMLALFVLNFVLLWKMQPVYFVSFGLMILFLIAALFKISGSAYYFLLMNFAMFKGSLLSFRKEHGGGWKREARGDESESKPSAGKSLVLLCALGLGISAILPSRAQAFTADVSAGTLNATEEMSSFNFNVSGHWWYPVDQMVFFGAGFGYERLGAVSLFPLVGSAYVYLPFGSLVMPVGTFDLGFAFGDDAQMIWRAGGGLDIKLGRKSSLLALLGCQNLKKAGDFVYLRCGLLIEI